MLRCLFQLQKIDDAKEALESLDDKTLADEEIKKIIKLLDTANPPTTHPQLRFGKENT